MDALTTIAAVNAALALVEALTPEIAALAQRGEISTDQQQTVLDRYNAVKKACEQGLVGSEWEQSNRGRLA